MRQTDHGEEPILVSMMKLTTLTCCLAVAGAVTLGAQSSESTTQTKIEVKDGKDVQVTGCVEAGFGGGYVLTNVADKSGAMHRYILVSDGDDFSKQVGHRVQIDGKAADRNRGKVEVERETKMEGVDKTTHSKTESSGDLASMPYLGVKLSLIHISEPT